MTRSVLKLLEENRKTIQSLQNTTSTTINNLKNSNDGHSMMSNRGTTLIDVACSTTSTSTIRPASILSSTTYAMDCDNNTITTGNTNNHIRRHDDDINTDTTERTVPEIIEDILQQEQWRNQRASKLDLDDFLSLLVEFNSHGIHFS